MVKKLWSVQVFQKMDICLKLENIPYSTVPQFKSGYLND